MIKIHKKIQSNIHFSSSNSTGTSVIEQFRANKSIQSITDTQAPKTWWLYQLKLWCTSPGFLSSYLLSKQQQPQDLQKLEVKYS
jgi:hypothetical protein